jgi:hypothetical protein
VQSELIPHPPGKRAEIPGLNATVKKATKHTQGLVPKFTCAEILLTHNRFQSIFISLPQNIFLSNTIGCPVVDICQGAVSKRRDIFACGLVEWIDP